MVLFDHVIGECLLMIRFGHVGSLKSKQKSNWNYMKSWKWDRKLFFKLNL